MFWVVLDDCVRCEKWVVTAAALVHKDFTSTQVIVNIVTVLVAFIGIHSPMFASLHHISPI